MIKIYFQRDALKLMVTILGGVAILTGCELLINPTQTPLLPSPTGSSSPLPSQTTTVTSTETPTKTYTETPNPYISFSPFEKTTWSPESQAYLTSLDSRQVAETGSTQEDNYVKEDQAFHLYYTQGLIDFLGKQKVDVSSFKNTDLLVYDNAIKVYEALWKYLAKNPESYNTNWVPMPWLLEQMLNQPSNMVRSYTDTQGNIHYGMSAGPGGTTENALLKESNTTDIKKALQLDRDLWSSWKFTIPIFGKKTEVPRPIDFAYTYGVLTALADHPGYPDGSIKIIIMGFQDENGKWVYQPFAVNLGKNKTKSSDYVSDGYNRVFQLRKDQEGYLLPVVGSNFPTTLSRKEYTVADLIKMINDKVYGAPYAVFGPLNHETIYLQYFFDGIESFGVIFDHGKAPVSPLSPADATPSPSPTP